MAACSHVGSRTQPAVAVAAALGATLLVVLLAAWAASIGPDDIFRGDGRPESGPTDVRTGHAETTGDRAQGDQPDRPDGEPPAWLNVLAVLIQVAALAGVVYLVVRVARWRPRRQRRPAKSGRARRRPGLRGRRCARAGGGGDRR